MVVVKIENNDKNNNNNNSNNNNNDNDKPYARVVNKDTICGSFHVWSKNQLACYKLA